MFPELRFVTSDTGSVQIELRDHNCMRGRGTQLEMVAEFNSLAVDRDDDGGFHAFYDGIRGFFLVLTIISHCISFPSHSVSIWYVFFFSFSYCCIFVQFFFLLLFLSYFTSEGKYARWTPSHISHSIPTKLVDMYRVRTVTVSACESSDQSRWKEYIIPISSYVSTAYTLLIN